MMDMPGMDIGPLLLSLKLALVTTLILLLVGVPIAYWLAYSSFRFKAVIETLVSMPLVLPPTVLGFYLLLFLSPARPFGAWLDQVLDVRLVFTFGGLVLASVIYSLPFMVHPVQAGFKTLDISLREAAYTLGKSPRTTFFKVLLPNIRTSILSGIVLSFAHTIGEFGVVLMIGGNIPGETRVASIALYDEVEALQYDTANTYAFVLFLLTFFILLGFYYINRRMLNVSR